MHGRRPSSGDGPRSNSPGMPAGRIPMENSRGFYNFNHKGSNRDFGRFPARPFPPPPPPPPPPLPNLRSDILMEAGRLAAEYLVSQGLLPANLLPGKSALGDFKSPELRAWDQKELSPIQTNSRTSALARLGDTMPDTAVPVRDDDVWPRRLGNSEPPFYGRRRFTAVDERPGFRGRQKRKPGGLYRGYGRENGRPGRGPPFADMPESEEDIPDYQIDNKRADVDAEGASQIAKPVSTREIVSFSEDKRADMDADEVQELAEPAPTTETAGLSDNQWADMDVNDAAEFSEPVPTSETASLSDNNKRLDMDANQSPQFTEPAGCREIANFSDSHVETSNTASGNMCIEEISLGGGQVHSSVNEDTMVEADHVTRVLDEKADNAVLSSDVVNDDKKVTNSDVNGKETDGKYVPAKVCKLEDSSASNHLNDPRKNVDCDLIRFCNFTKVPTKIRSVRQRPWSCQTDLRSVSSSLSNSENKIPSGTICDAEAVGSSARNTMGNCLSKSQLPEDPLSGITKSKVAEAASTKDIHKSQELVLTIDMGQESGDNVLVSPYSAKEELADHTPEFNNLKDEVISQDSGGSGCVLMIGRSSDEFMHHEVLGSKTPMDWLSPRNSQPDVYLLRHDQGVQASTVQASTSKDGHFSKNDEIIETDAPSSQLDSATTMMIEGAKHESSSHPILSDSDRLHENEKQLLPCSFPIFDVNLSAEFDDVIQNHVASQYSLTEVEEEASRRVGLLMRDISNGDQGRVDPSNDFFVGPPGNDTWTGYDINTIEAGVFRTALVELFNKMPLVRKLYHNKSTLTKLKCLVCCGSNREMLTTYSSLEDLLDHTRNSDYLPKVHRGYGSAITDLLEMDPVNNSSSSIAMSDLHSDVYLGFGEVLPEYDDQIYLSLDEISVDLPEV